MHSLGEIRRRESWGDHDRARGPVNETGRALMLYYAMLCYAMLRGANTLFWYIHLQVSKHETQCVHDCSQDTRIPAISYARFDATSKCTIDLPSGIHMLFHAQNAKNQALHGASQLRNSLASTVGDG